MRPGAVRIESKGSLWWFDEDAHEYLRLPKNEGPRERPEWSDERASVLQDAVWHPYESFAIEDWHERDGQARPPGLYITFAGRAQRAYAPEATT